jgi:hypothetical protein
MRALISTGTVTAGQTYFITDVGMAGIQVQGIDANSITSQGQYIGYFPDYQNTSGDFAQVWNVMLASCTVGKLYAWNGAMYESVNGVTGSDPSTAPTSEWLLIDKTDSRYQKEILTVQYDVVSNTISKGEDARGNIITGSLGFATFKWGCDTCNNNTMSNTIGDVYNLGGIVAGNSFVSCEIRYPFFTGNLEGNTLTSTIVSYVSIYPVFVNLAQCYSSGGEILVENTSTTDDVNISGCQFFGASGSAINIISSGKTITKTTFANNQIVADTFSAICGNFNLSDSYIGLYIVLSKNSSGLYVTSSYSNHEATIDLDLNMTGNKLSMPSEAQGAGVWILTSAATKTINEIYITTTLNTAFPITIKPANGKSVVIDTIAIGSATTDNIVSSGTNETLVGRTNGSDFYTIQRSGTMWQKINSSVNV